MSQPALPAELILYTIECLIPPDPPIIFPRDHEVTRTLLNLTLVCKLVSRRARQLLIKYCLQIDSGDRLDQLLQSGVFCSTRNNLPSSINLFLAPFPVENLNIPPTVQQVETLSTLLCHSLTRLIIDMPLRYLYPEEDIHYLRPILRAAFSRMTALEEFTSVRDELYLATDPVPELDEAALEAGEIPELQPMVWSFWPNLSRLALYNVAVDHGQFLGGLQKCQRLTHLVLVRPDGLAEEVDPEKMGMDKDFLPALQRLVIVNTGLGFLHTSPFDEASWEASFVGRLDALRKSRGGDGDGDGAHSESSVASYLSLRMPFGRDDEDIEICQEWLAKQATSGLLWGLSDKRQDLLHEHIMRSPAF
ncbi:hypothetical protein BDV06DRAFT_218172 [Aspergillus oleicola]